MNIQKLKSLFLFLPVAVVLIGCVSTKKAIYFNGLGDGTITSSTPIPETVIGKNDLLSITVSSLNPEASAIFNTPNTYMTNINGSNANSLMGYLVSNEGTIQFPILGTIRALGLTKEQLKETITKKLVDQKLLTDPIVIVRFLNFRVTVLGEVNHPSMLSVPNEKISLLEAIGLAGDLTIYAKRDNVLVIREDDNGNKEIKRIDLSSTELLSSPYYYLKSNDIVYVEPNKSRVASAGRGQLWVPAVLSGLSLVAIVVDRMVR
ncbi:MAG: polysaccharide biosynthesis/export family protein [Chitinophagaceae bacterium]|nr:polysaccharide biosynthesis/export family protein [Chitinophagaceae bacterium]